MPVGYAVPDRFYSIGNYYPNRRARITESQNSETSKPLLDITIPSHAVIRIIEQAERLEKIRLNIKE